MVICAIWCLLLGAVRCCLVMFGAVGSFWVLLALYWLPLGVVVWVPLWSWVLPGACWALLGALEWCWAMLGAFRFGCCWAIGCCWALLGVDAPLGILGAFRCCWVLLGAVGHCCVLLGAVGCCWALLGADGYCWVLYRTIVGEFCGIEPQGNWQYNKIVPLMRCNGL